MNGDVLKKQSKRISSILKALANERRIQILCHLREEEKSVGELEKLVGLSQSALSQHLAKLRRDKIVTTRRHAQTIYYSIKDTCPEQGDIRKVLEVLCDFLYPEKSK